MDDLERQIKDLYLEVHAAKQHLFSVEERLSQIEGQLGVRGRDSAASFEGKFSKAVTSLGEGSPQGGMASQPTQLEENMVTGLERVKSKFNEAFIGKYLIGSVAALFVLLAAIMGAVLVWGNLSDAVKFMFIVIAGLSIAACGYGFIGKWHKVITSILIGTGAGTVFIGIISGYMVFELLNVYVVISLFIVWSVGLNLSFQKTKTFFTSVVSYIGVFVALILMLSNLIVIADIIATYIFLAVTLGAFMLSAYLWMDGSKQVITSVMSFLLVLVCFIRLGFYDLIVEFGVVHIFYCRMVLIASFMALVLYAGKILRDSYSLAKYITVEVIMFLMCCCVLLWHFNGYVFNIPVFKVILIDNLFGYFIGFIIFLSFCLYFKKEFISPLVFLTYLFVIISDLFYGVGITFQFGFSVIALWTILVKDVKFNKKYLVTLIALGCALVNLLMQRNYFVLQESTSLLGLLALILEVGCLLTASILIVHKIKGFYRLFLFVVVSISTALFTCFFIPNIWSVFGQGGINWRGIVFGAVLSSMSLAALYFRYFALDEEYFLVGSSSGTKRYLLNKSGSLFSTGLSFLYFYNLTIYAFEDVWYSSLIALFIVLITVAGQSYVLLYKYKGNKLANIWFCLKYLILTWTILGVSFDVGLDTIYISISSILLAVGIIMLGFKFKVKTFRVFGLVITLLMTVKAVLVDLSMNSTGGLIISLLVGGVICFVISVLYTKLERLLRSDDLSIK